MTSEEYKKIRKQCGLTQTQAAPLLGLHQSGIARIESGSRAPSKQQAAALRLLATIARHGLLDEVG